VVFSRVCGLLPRLACWPRLVQAGFPPAPAPQLLITARTLAVSRKEEKGSARRRSSLPIAPLADPGDGGPRPPLSLTSVLGHMVKHSKSQNIEINRYALEHDKVFPMPSGLRNIKKRDFVPGATSYPECLNKPNLPDIIKTGKFNPEEERIILSNWKKLVEATGYSAQEEEVKVILFDNTDKADDIKASKKVIGCWLAQGLQKTRLPSDVFHRAKILLCSVRGELSDEEKQQINAFVAEQPKDWAKLSRTTGRRPENLRNNYNNTLSHSDKKKSGAFTQDESEEVMRQVFDACPTVLTSGEVGGQTSEVFLKLGTKLDRKPCSLYKHWKRVEHMLTRHQAGTLDVDFSDRIVHYMVKNGLKYRQDVNWGEMTNLPEFRGTTTTFLMYEYHRMVGSANRHRDFNNKDITSDLVLKWNKNKKPRGKPKDQIEKEEAFIEFWSQLSSGK